MDPNEVEAVRALLEAADLQVPPERHAMLAKRFRPMLALTRRLSVRMSHTAGVAPVTRATPPAPETSRE
jgi:hypothetical protein